jgi:hypothetical protein
LIIRLPPLSVQPFRPFLLLVMIRFVQAWSAVKLFGAGAWAQAPLSFRGTREAREPGIQYQAPNSRLDSGFAGFASAPE